MAYVPVPEGPQQSKNKGLIQPRQAAAYLRYACGTVGVPIYFLLKPHLVSSIMAIIMIVALLLFLFFAIYDKVCIPNGKVYRIHYKGGVYTKQKQVVTK